MRTLNSASKRVRLSDDSNGEETVNSNTATLHGDAADPSTSTNAVETASDMQTGAPADEYGPHSTTTLAKGKGKGKTDVGAVY